MVNTCTTLIEALTSQYSDLTDVEIERYFVFSLIWSFAGTLEANARETFSVWFRNKFNNSRYVQVCI